MGEDEARLDLAGALEKQGHSGVALELLWVVVVWCGDLQGWEGVDPLRGDAQGLSRGREELELGGRGEQGCDGRVDHLLEVVQDQQHLFACEVVGEGVFQGAPLGLSQGQGLGDVGNDEVWVGGGGEVDEEDPVGKGVKELSSGGEGEAGLARAPGAGEGH